MPYPTLYPEETISLIAENICFMNNEIPPTDGLMPIFKREHVRERVTGMAAKGMVTATGSLKPTLMARFGLGLLPWHQSGIWKNF